MSSVLNVVCPICKKEYPFTPKAGQRISCPCGLVFDFADLKWKRG